MPRTCQVSLLSWCMCRLVLHLRPPFIIWTYLTLDQSTSTAFLCVCQRRSPKRHMPEAEMTMPEMQLGASHGYEHCEAHLIVYQVVF